MKMNFQGKAIRISLSGQKRIPASGGNTLQIIREGRRFGENRR